VSIGGRDVTELSPAERNVAMGFGDVALLPHLDVAGNVAFGLSGADLDGATTERRVARAASAAGVEDLLDRAPDDLTAEQRRRVGIARAVVREPDALLLDGPLSTLDADRRVEARETLRRLHEELRLTVVCATTDAAEAMALADRMAVVDGGSVHQFAPPATCYDEPATRFVATFLGSPSMNVLDGQVTADGWSDGRITVGFEPARDGLDPGDEVALGVRPEDVVPVDEAGAVDSPTGVIGATVDGVETRGTEAVVTLGDAATTGRAGAAGTTPGRRAGDGRRLLMCTPVEAAPDAGERIEVVLDRAAVHLFDRETGDALRHGLGPVTGAGGPTEPAGTDG
jgi:multiple sugar transport system ATP-binding protein